MTATAIDLDGALGDTRPLWRDWLADAGRVLDVDVAALPVDRAVAAALLDAHSLARAGATLGVFTDAPDELARVAAAHLGAGRRVGAVEAGAGALERLEARLGSEVLVVRSRAELLAAATSA